MVKTLSKTFLVLLFAAGASFGAAAADDPSIHQVYEAANSGHLDQARSMMSQVLKDHPESAKAHYVAAQIDARSGDLASARAEFQSAEKLAPGLPFDKPSAVQELRNQLYPQQQVQPPRYTTPVNPVQPVRAHGGFPWGTALGIGFAVWIVWLIFRRFSAPPAPPVYGGGYGPGGAAPGGGYYGPGGGYPPPAGGGLLGSLGTGLAVGAGVVAGEEIAHRLLDGNDGERVIERDVVYRDPPQNPNPDMGGNDFGINDSSSWDSGDSGGLGGSDDSWS
jgi:hypothetical protein